VQVRDTGIGIPADQQHRIRRFLRADGSTTRQREARLAEHLCGS
jgi:signal transduction histidine kinase